MPTYTYKDRNIPDAEPATHYMSISEMEAFEKANPNMERVYDQGLPILDSWRLGLVKPSDNHKSRMKQIAKAHPRGKVDVPG